MRLIRNKILEEHAPMFHIKVEGRDGECKQERSSTGSQRYTSFTFSLTLRNESRTPTWTVRPFRMTRMPQPFTTFPSVTIHPATRPLPLLKTARISAEPIGIWSYQQRRSNCQLWTYNVKILRKKKSKYMMQEIKAYQVQVYIRSNYIQCLTSVKEKFIYISKNEGEREKD